jgi:hypothetical protein
MSRSMSFLHNSYTLKQGKLGYYAAVGMGMNEPHPQATSMELTKIVLSKRSQTHKKDIFWILLIKIQKWKNLSTVSEVRKVASRKSQRGLWLLAFLFLSVVNQVCTP